MSRFRLVSALATVAILVALGGCGSGEGDGSTSKTTAPTSQALTVTANAKGEPKFDQATLNATAGPVVITMMNPQSSGEKHGIGIQGPGVSVDGGTVKPGRSSSLSITLKPGTYTFYDPAGGNRKAGMKGTLVVVKK